MEWFYANGGNRVGPVSAVTFEGLLRDGVVTGETLVWARGMSDWQRWSDVEPTTGVCANSGGRFFARDLTQVEGRTVSTEAPDSPRTRAAEAGSHATMRYAGFWVRFVAKFLDGLLLWVVNTAANLAWSVAYFGHVVFMPDASQISLRTLLGFQALTIVSSVAIGCAYQCFFLTRHGATPGKMALSLKVVRSDGGPLTSGRAIGRYFSEILSSLILCIGYIMAAFDDEKRALHDRICDTRVIRTD
jgi:uncharacterized RDD family membrane protein YckC